MDLTDDNDHALRPRLSKILSAINSVAMYWKLITFIAASFASSDLELLKLLKRPVALRYRVHLLPSTDKLCIGSGCRENLDPPPITEACGDQQILWKRSRRLRRWSLINCADVVTESFFVTGETRPTAEFIESDGDCSEQYINELSCHSLPN